MSEEMTVKVDGEDAIVSLMDLAGMDMDAVEAVEFGFTTPAGIFVFEIEIAELGSRDSKNGEKPVIAIKMKIANVEKLAVETDDAGNLIDADKMIGTFHVETFWISNLEQTLGQLKTFWNSIGYQGTGNLSERLAGMSGVMFRGVIKHTKDKNDPDQVYSNLNFKKVAPYEAPVEAAVA